ncbi:hypothetical protein D3C80_465200 [compost metagenome]
MRMPPIATQRNVPSASVSENVPVTAAATANRMQTRPDASLSSDSPSRMCINRGGIGTRAAIAETATGSVGETMAASAKATASGMAGIIQWIRSPTPTTVNTTSPSASSRMTPLSRNSPSFGMRQPSRNRSGGRNSRKKISGSSTTPSPVIPVIAAPKAIWISGSGTGSGSSLEIVPLRMTASSRTRAIVILSMVFSIPCCSKSRP